MITIGLSTITYNPTATAIIIAAGDAKAPIVACAIQEKKSPLHPASVLQDLPAARFYLTKGAASRLSERRYEDFVRLSTPGDFATDDNITGIALARGRALDDLKKEDLEDNRCGRELLAKTGATPSTVASEVRQRMIVKIERGMKPVSQTVFLHTEPHHDDIMLAYLPHIYHLVRDPSNQHHFVNLTSGFTAVSNPYCLSLIRKLQHELEHDAFGRLLKSGYFNPKSVPNRMADVYLYLDGVAGNSPEKRNEADARRMLRSMFEDYRTTDMRAVGVPPLHILRVHNGREYRVLRADR